MKQLALQECGRNVVGIRINSRNPRFMGAVGDRGIKRGLTQSYGCAPDCPERWGSPAWQCLN